jgi:outer membrane receptor protein involved in Fe transport
MRTAVASSLASAFILTAGHAAAQQAQTPAPAAKAPSESTVADVVVTAERPPVRTAIDRKSYNVASDIASANGSISDVLRNVPSVEVDVDGNVSVRGAGVQILLDGQPSAMFQGDARSQILQQMPANTIETIEVITNPSAEFSPDGAGGVINLVTKKVRKVGKSGSVQGVVGSNSRARVTALGVYSVGKLNLTGTASFGRQKSVQEADSDLTYIDPQTSSVTRAFSETGGGTDSRSFNASGTLDYDLTTRDRLSLNGFIAFNERDDATLTVERREDGAGVVQRDDDFLNTSRGPGRSGGLTGSWRRTFATQGQVLNVSLRHSESGNESVNGRDYDYRVPVADRVEERRTTNRGANDGLTISYVHPLPDGASLRTGYEYQRNLTDVDVDAVLFDAAGGEADLPNITNHFVFVQRNHQAYATWQRPFGKLTVLAGARLELAQIEYDQRTTAILGDSDYTDIHPSLHLQYALTENQNLRLSYSHRVDRPSGSQLNPFLIVSTEFSALSGNPDLRPQETHSLEAGWGWQKGQRNASATVYYRQNYNTIGSVNRFITPTIVLSTFENQGDSRSGGLELDTGGRIMPTLSYRAYANIAYSELQRSTLGGGDTRSAYSYTVRGNLDWRPTDKDLLQITGTYAGKRIFAQGYSLPSGAVNLGYQRKIRKDLIAVATVSDIFASSRSASILDTATIFGRSSNQLVGRTVSVGITRLFGGRQARDGQFEYDTGS